jgi:hypothetical protein
MVQRGSRSPFADLARGWRRMTPNRIFLRLMTGGRYETARGLVRGAVRSSAPSPRSIPMRPVPYGSPLPTTKASAQKSRAAAKKTAAKQPVIKKTARGKQVAKRGAGGKFEGSVTLPGADLTLYKQVQAGRAVIQPGEPNRRRL